MLLFKNPRDSTPGPYDQTLTYNGKSLPFKSPKGDFKRSTFSRSRRFSQYSVEESRTGYRVGPGSYDTPTKWQEASGSPVYRLSHGNRDMTHNGYFYVGQSLGFSSSFMSIRHRRSLKSGDFTIDPSVATKKRPKSSLSKFRSKDVSRVGLIVKKIRKTATPVLKLKRKKRKNVIKNLLKKRLNR